MMRSMYSGVSGLRVHQTKMDVIGNNIANVNTIGYKAQRVNFNEVFSQTLQGATASSDATGRGGVNPMQVGLGVNVSSIDLLMTQGAAQRTDNPFDLMIDGEGFIVVGDDSGSYFTRAGALRQDAEGNLVIPNGMKVQGWAATKDGKGIDKGEVQDLQLGSADNKFSEPEATKDVRIEGNLNIADGVVKEDGTGGIKTSIKVYDSLGNMYTTPVKMIFDEASKEWTLQPELVDGKMILTNVNMKDDPKTDQIVDNKYAVENVFPEDGILIKFDTNGKLLSAGSDNSTEVILEKAINLKEATQVELDENGEEKVTTTAKGVEADTKALTIDFSGLTQYQSKTNVDSKTVDGRPAGSMMGYDIGGDGKITAYYDNGETKFLGQIVLAHFDNPAGLEKAGDNLFRATVNSGDFDHIGKEGIFKAGVLEMSNVDLSREFTEMITTQRGFQANSRIISVSDEMLQELVNLKR